MATTTYIYTVSYRYNRKGAGQMATRGYTRIRAASSADAKKKVRKRLVQNSNARPASIDMSAIRAK